MRAGGGQARRPRWRIPKPEGGYSDGMEAKTVGLASRILLGQALEGRIIKTDARFVLDDGSVVHGHRGMMSAR